MGSEKKRLISLQEDRDLDIREAKKKTLAQAQVTIAQALKDHHSLITVLDKLAQIVPFDVRISASWGSAWVHTTSKEDFEELAEKFGVPIRESQYDSYTEDKTLKYYSFQTPEKITVYGESFPAEKEEQLELPL